MNAPQRMGPGAKGQVVLVLQGGGALGAYQAGVYEALCGAGTEPDWVIGTSIGAFNAGLIAGNARENRLPRLREFWRRVEQDSPFGYYATLAGGIPALFAPRPMTWGANTQTRVGLDAASWYDTAPLRHTLSELVDVRILNEAKTRLTVGAGDGFAVGVISALLEGRPVAEAVRRGAWIGARAVQVLGDTEGLPNRQQLAAEAL